MATVPVAVYLRSGDITVLSGDSRLACHAVPRILPQHCNTFRASCFDPPDQLDSTQQAGSCPGDSDHQRKALPEAYNSFVCNSSSDDRTRDNQSMRSGQDLSDILPTDVASQDSCDDHLLKETANRTNADVIQTLQDPTWDPLGEYIAVNRINMNVRQVLKCGQTFPSVAD